MFINRNDITFSGVTLPLYQIAEAFVSYAHYCRSQAPKNADALHPLIRANQHFLAAARELEQGHAAAIEAFR